MIGRAELLGDDAFQRQFAGRLQDGVAAGLEMLDITDQLGFALGPRLQQLLQLRLPLAERQAAKEIVRLLVGFTLAVETAAVFLDFFASD